MKLFEAYNNFIEYQIVVGNSPATISYYSYCLMPFINKLGNNTNLKNITKDKLIKYAMSLRAKQLSSVSIRSYSKGIKSFLSWLYKNNLTNINLSELYILPKQQTKEINILSDCEVNRLLNSFDITTQQGLRNYLIITLMYDSGLRKSEIIKLKLSDVDITSSKLLINGKGNKQRFVPLGNTTSKQLQKYITKYDISLTNCIFSTNNNQPITNATINRLFKTLKTKLQIQRLHPHLLRHTFATKYLINGGNITTLQQILGHSDIQTVQIYLHIAQSHTISQFTKYSPLDNAPYN